MAALEDANANHCLHDMRSCAYRVAKWCAENLILEMEYKKSQLVQAERATGGTP